MRPLNKVEMFTCTSDFLADLNNSNAERQVNIYCGDNRISHKNTPGSIDFLPHSFKFFFDAFTGIKFNYKVNFLLTSLVQIPFFLKKSEKRNLSIYNPGTIHPSNLL